jgi:hypothetical protein
LIIRCLIQHLICGWFCHDRIARVNRSFILHIITELNRNRIILKQHYFKFLLNITHLLVDNDIYKGLICMFLSNPCLISLTDDTSVILVVET